MELKLMAVATSTHKQQAKIMITGSWLDRFGFAPETVVTAFYQNGQLLLQARGMGLDIYKQFVGEVRKRRGQIIQVFNWTRKKTETHLILEGDWLEKQGFQIGDPILVGFESGLIRIKHLPLNEIGFSVSNIATYRMITVQSNGRSPMIYLNAGWLHDYGFIAGQGAVLAYESGFLTMQPCPQSTDKVVKSKMPTHLNVLLRRNVPCLQVAGQWLSEIGYCTGVILIVQCLDQQLFIRPLKTHDLYF